MRKLVIAISGASGAIYARAVLDKLMSVRDQWTEIGLVMTQNAAEVWETELGNQSYNTYELSSYSQRDFSAPFASGSGQFDTMIIVPCSMGILGRIAGGISSDLITRAADVILKERRKLICVVRETPYNLVHIRNMETVTLSGGIICPATPSFYSKPATIEQLVSTVADRILDLAGIQISTFRWGGTANHTGPED